MNIKKLIAYLVIPIILLGGGAYILKKNKEENDAKTKIVAQVNTSVNVNTAQAKYELISQDYVSNGTFAPIQQLSFSSEIGGKIISVLVKEGSRVSKGQVLATIRKDAIEVDNSNARAVYENAVIDNQRYENAFKTGGVTKQQLDQSRLSLKNAKASLQRSNIQMGDTNIKASINGIINKKYIEPGAVVSSGAPLFDIVNISSLKLQVTVNEYQVAHLQTGKNITIQVSAYPTETFVGKVTFISPAADSSLNFPVEIEVSNLQNRLKAGMYGTAIFSSAEDSSTKKNLLLIPKEAFVNGVNNNQVFVVTKDNKVKLTKVIAGQIFGDKVEVLQGLKDGETVVTSGQINLVDGTTITIIK